MSFEQLISRSALASSDRPKFITIADILSQAIQSAQLVAGDKLPPQRDLAAYLKVTTGTVSRAYAQLEQVGLATARVGDGTYVRKRERVEFRAGSQASPSHIDLAHNIALSTDEGRAFQNALAEISADHETIQNVLAYQSEMGTARHREAGAEWLRRFGMNGNAGRVMVTHGGQHALACAMRTLAPPGATVLAEALNYPGLRGLALSMRIQLIGVESDEEGLVPSALERAAKTYGTKFVFMTPTLQNPTTSTMSIGRREEIATIAKRNGLFIIEDCVHAAILEAPLPAISSMLPEQSFLISSFSKVVAPGLRVGYLETSPQWLSKVAATMRADCWMAAPLMPEIATRWLESGTMERLIALERQEIAARLDLAQTMLKGLEYRMVEHHPLIWLPLPDPWQTGQFAAALRQAGVIIRSANHFAVGRSAVPHAVRISLNASPSRAELTKGLDILRRLLDDPPSIPMDP